MWNLKMECPIWNEDARFLDNNNLIDNKKEYINNNRERQQLKGYYFEIILYGGIKSFLLNFIKPFEALYD